MDRLGWIAEQEAMQRAKKTGKPCCVVYSAGIYSIWDADELPQALSGDVRAVVNCQMLSAAEIADTYHGARIP
jgi:hypothetical protein